MTFAIPTDGLADLRQHSPCQVNRHEFPYIPRGKATMKLHTLTLAGLLALAIPLFAAPATAQAQASVPISITNDLGSFVGSFTPTQFVKQRGQVALQGVLTGTVTNAAGTALGTITQTITLPISALQVQGDCEILHLE